MHIHKVNHLIFYNLRKCYLIKYCIKITSLKSFDEKLNKLVFNKLRMLEEISFAIITFIKLGRLEYETKNKLIKYTIRRKRNLFLIRYSNVTI